MESRSETRSLVSDHCGILIALLTAMNKTRVDVMQGLRTEQISVTATKVCDCYLQPRSCWKYKIWHQYILNNCACRWLLLTELVCRLTYKQLVVFKESKPGLWTSKIGFRATPALLGWNKDLNDQMLGVWTIVTSVTVKRLSIGWLYSSHNCWKATSQNQQVLTPTGKKRTWSSGLRHCLLISAALYKYMIHTAKPVLSMYCFIMAETPPTALTVEKA